MFARIARLALLFTLLATVAVVPQSRAFADDDDERNVLQRIPITGTLSDGGKFSGYVTITNLVLADDETTLLASGVIEGRATKADGKRVRVKQSFVDQAVGVQPSEQGGAQAAQEATRCNILFLFVGPIFLDLLGLQLTVTPFVIDLTAVSGQGRLLGNLLCAIANLLN